MQYLNSIAPFPTTFDRLWSSLNDEFGRRSSGKTDQGGFSPRVDVLESADAYLVALEIPGVDPSTVEVTLLDEVLTVKGTKPAALEPKEGERTWARERPSGDFERKFRFPVDVDPDGVSAEASHGVLTVRVAKAPETRPRRIDVRVNG